MYLQLSYLGDLSGLGGVLNGSIGDLSLGDLSGLGGLGGDLSLGNLSRLGDGLNASLGNLSLGNINFIS
ncbi:unnamed protein product [Larinioides sclopetarius]|uniref:Uncharacterized protein n=1 Tax=Larinioides sclopetarius TaxID=280406 RepID=A0AAV2C1M1_9ARAC